MTHSSKQSYSKRNNSTFMSHPIDSPRNHITTLSVPLPGRFRDILVKTLKHRRKTSVFAHVDILWVKMGILKHLAAILGHLGAILGPSWGHLGVILGPSWGQLGASWGHLGGAGGRKTVGKRVFLAMSGHLGQEGYLEACCFHLGPS